QQALALQAQARQQATLLAAQTTQQAIALRAAATQQAVAQQAAAARVAAVASTIVAQPRITNLGVTTPFISVTTAASRFVLPAQAFILTPVTSTPGAFMLQTAGSGPLVLTMPFTFTSPL